MNEKMTHRGSFPLSDALPASSFTAHAYQPGTAASSFPYQ